MGKIDEFITSLEGNDSIDPLEVARTLHELHNEEIGIRDAKILELENEKVGLANTLSEKDQEIVGWKAKNFDLVMQIPGAQMPTQNSEGEATLPASNEITFDDFFEEKDK